MPELILHHYDSSPFSEKMRLIFGFKKMRWRSVKIPNVMPKPDLVALTGGYRKTPVLQIGADIHCDTALMARVVERIVPEPRLFPDEQPLAECFAAWADSTLFWTVVPVVMQPAGLAYLFAGAPADAVKIFGADRAAFTAGLKRQTLADASAQSAVYLLRFERALARGRAFLFGDAPCIADFSLAHCLWFVARIPALAGVLAPYPCVMAYLERMRAFGHGERSEMKSDEALAVAAAADAAPALPLHFDESLGFARGEAVTVAAIDYGSDPVSGALVGLTRDEIALERSDERAGRVIVHFPRIGFQLRREQKETIR